MLTGSRVLLRAPLEADRPFLFGLRNDVELQMQLLVLPRANSSQRVEEWLAKHGSDPAALFFIIALRAGNEPLGFIQLTAIDWVHGRGELGICLAAPAQHKGYGREALALLEGYARAVFNIRKIILYVLDSNLPAVKLYDQAGYATVGILKQHFYQQHAYHDVRLMEKLLA
jgi:diamine N-acetyltransferase